MLAKGFFLAGGDVSDLNVWHEQISIEHHRPVRTCALVMPARTWTEARGDRKSTRLNSSHLGISYAVFCLKKKKSEGHLYGSLMASHSRAGVADDKIST